MAKPDTPFSLRSFLLWLGLIFVAAGLWVPVRDSQHYAPESWVFWSRTVWPGLTLVMLAPMWVWRGRWMGFFRGIYVISLAFFCIALTWTPASCLVRHGVWIAAHSCATLAFFVRGRQAKQGFSPRLPRMGDST